jgi:flagellin
MAITPVPNTVSLVAAAPVAPRAPTVSQASTVTSNTDVNSSASSSTSSPQSPLYKAAVDFAQLNSFLEVARTGNVQAGTVLQQLQKLAAQAANGGSDADVAQLDSEFQALLSEFGNTVSTTQFAGKGLFNNNASSSGAGQDVPVALPDLSTQALFGNNSPNLLTSSNASSALDAINNALGIVSDTGKAIVAAQSQAEYGAAQVETAIANNDASTAILTEADLSGTVSDVLSVLVSKPANSAQAQTGNLPGNILSLLQE